MHGLTPPSFDRIFKEHGALVWGIIRKFGLKGPDTDDLFMLIWEAVWESLDDFSGRSKLSTWIGGIARHKCVDYLRKPRLRRLDDPGSIQRLESRGAGEGGEPLLTPSRKAVRKEAKEAIERALKELPPAQNLIVKRWMFGFSYREIAEMFNASGGGPVDTNYVGKQLFLAKSRVAAALKPAGIEGIEDIWE